MQTILGAGGAIGIELAKALPNYTNKVRLVGRSPKNVNESDELMTADLLDAKAILSAVEGSEVVYLTAGLTYNTKLWQRDWPIVMKNVLDACVAHKSRFVFFDNVYMIGGDNVNHITERSPFSPVSKKGKVREELNRMIFDSMNKHQLETIIARSADFYGPNVTTSIVMELMFKNLKKGKRPQWFGAPDKIHSNTFTPDAGKAIALLGNTLDTFGEVWNVPTDPTPLTGQDWANLFAEEMGGNAKLQILPKWMIKALGVFIPVMREFPEMMYQYDRDYFFDSAKFTERFNISATPAKEGVKATVAALKNS